MLSQEEPAAKEELSPCEETPTARRKREMFRKIRTLLFRKGLGKSPFVSAVLTVNNLFHGVWKKIVYRRPADD